jgi:hypothetical protein
MKRADLFANLQRFQYWNKIKMKQNTPSNLFKRDVIKTCQHFPFHLPKGPCTASNAESELRRAPVLFNEIQLAMIFGIEVAQVAARFDILLEQRLLRHEIGLGVKEVATAATGLSLRTLGASALDREAALGPKAALANDVFHTLEPPRIIGVVVWKVKRLGLPC